MTRESRKMWCDRRVLLGAVLLAAMLLSTCFLLKHAFRFSPAATDAIYLQAGAYQAAPDMVVFDMDATRSEALLDLSNEYLLLPNTNPRAVGHIPQSVKQWYTSIGGKPSERAVILSRHMPAEVPALVILDVRPATDGKDQDVHLTITAWRSGGIGTKFSFSLRELRAKAALPPLPLRNLKCFAGQVDRLTPLRFSFQYELEGEAGVIEGHYLFPSREGVHLQIRNPSDWGIERGRR